MLNVYLEEGISHDQFTRENKKMAGELTRLKDESKGLVNVPDKWQPGDIKRDWAILEPLERREVLGAFIDYIVIKPGRIAAKRARCGILICAGGITGYVPHVFNRLRVSTKAGQLQVQEG